MLEQNFRVDAALLSGAAGECLPEDVEEKQNECPKGNVSGNIASDLQLLFYPEAIFHTPSVKRSHGSAIVRRCSLPFKAMLTLNAAELRVLGALIEKGTTTPEYYPLSLNALVNACNQKSSRDPVMEMTEAEVRTALFDLEQLGLVRVLSDARVSKFEHLAYGKLSLNRPETAVLGLLLLRGPQTVAELRARAERMYAFDDTAAVTAVLERLSAREQPLVVQLARQPGARESRWMHLLGGSVENATVAGEAGVSSAVHDNSLQDRLAELERLVEALEARVQALEQTGS